MNNEFAAGGIGASLLASMLVFYLLYLALFFAQHAGVTAMGSPNERFTFADALTRGLKAGLTFLVLILVFFVVYFVLGLIAALVLGLASLASEAVGLALGVLLIPVSIYLTCRFALITPVVAVEGVFNPIKAINRAWSVTKGHALGILVVIVVNIVLAIMFLAVPFLVIAVSGGGGLGVQLTGAPAFFAIITFLFGFVLFQLISAILFAAVHAKISGYNEEQLEDVFE
ncbi:MAG: hypothetical protein HRT64_09595 [Erythrobacter sp.]|nr:hypothetical protein [Erythrobacter sp.]